MAKRKFPKRPVDREQILNAPTPVSTEKELKYMAIFLEAQLEREIEQGESEKHIQAAKKRLYEFKKKHGIE